MKRRDLTGFAVDLGGTKTAVARIVQGEVVDRRQAPTDGAADVAALFDAVGGMLADLGRTQDDLLGVTVTGRLSFDRLWSAVNAGTLPRIEQVPLGAHLDQRFGDRVAASNDAAATALAEALFGAGRGCRIFVYLTVSTGVGGGLVLDGGPVVSARGLAGHLGFLSSPHGRDICGSGRRATVESVAGGRAVAAAAERAGHSGMSAKEVFSAADQGARWATSIIEDSARAIATLCGDLAAALDPDRIAIGGSIGLAPGYLDRVRTWLATEPELFRAPLLPAELGPDGPLLGALAHATRERSA